MPRNKGYKKKSASTVKHDDGVFGKSKSKSGEKRKLDASVSVTTNKPSKSAKAPNQVEKVKAALRRLDEKDRVSLFTLMQEVNRLDKDRGRPPALREKTIELKMRMKSIGLGGQQS